MTTQTTNDRPRKVAAILTAAVFQAQVDCERIPLEEAGILTKRLDEMHKEGMAWVGFDFDRTLVHYDGWVDHSHVGETIQTTLNAMLNLVRRGYLVKIFTARVFPIISYPISGAWDTQRSSVVPVHSGLQACRAIREWCLSNVGVLLPITNVKDPRCVALFDDIAVQMEPNQGVRSDGLPLLEGVV